MKSPLPLAPLLALAGCMADQGAFPTLAPRAIESVDPWTEPAVAPPAPVPADPAQASFAAEQLAIAEAGERTFRQTLAETGPAIRAGQGQPAGGERWIAAQLALSRLQASRAAVADALRAIDARRVSVADPALDAANARIVALDNDQEREVAALAALLAG